MAWEVEVTDEFLRWWESLIGARQEDVAAHVQELEKRGPTLPHPYSTDVTTSKHGNMRELRVQSGGRPLRIFYAFDPRRAAILLIAGDKTGDKRFYDRFVPLADSLYDEHLAEIRMEESRSHGRQSQIRGASRTDVPGGPKTRRSKG